MKSVISLKSQESALQQSRSGKELLRDDRDKKERDEI